MELKEQIRRASVLIEALPYIQGFRGKTIVIKYGGSAMENPELMQAVLRDLVFLEAVGVNPVLVHGGGKFITQRLKEKVIETRFSNGLRITDEATVAVVDEVLNTRINPEIVDTIVSLGGRAKTISGRTVFRARKNPPVIQDGQEVDLGFVGEVESCQLEEVNQLISQETIPVISPLGGDGAGHAYNINADVAAAEVAIGVRAFKLIYLSDVNGILADASDPHSTISTVNATTIETLRQKGIITGGMLPKVQSCLRALDAGVEKIHLVDGRIAHSLLLELFTDRGIGTEIINTAIEL